MCARAHLAQSFTPQEVAHIPSAFLSCSFLSTHAL